MKRSVFLLLLVVMTIGSASAQFIVNSSGRSIFEKTVAIGTNVSPVDTIGINIRYRNDKYRICGVKSYIQRKSSPTWFRRCGIGLLGQVGIDSVDTYSSQGVVSPVSFYAGVAGLADNGVGVYGAVGVSALPLNLSGDFAGYFNGKVKVVGNLTATSVTTSSDIRFKENVQNIAESAILENLRNLRPVSYNFNNQDKLLSIEDNSQDITKTHYGLIAQEVEKVFPDVVYKDEDGYLSINYIELIPLLIESHNQMAEKIELLEGQLQNFQKQERINSNSKDIEAAVLYQNIPNPFNINTAIGYELPQTTSAAMIYIYDMTGAQVGSYKITEFGEGSITINGGDFKAGIYLYSLIADGKLIDTKRMILTK